LAFFVDETNLKGRVNMPGRDAVKIAFDLKEPARIPTTLIAGGSWAINMAGETFAGVKENPEWLQ
jgi:hypothetical protein